MSAAAGAPAKETHLPPLIRVGDLVAPRAPHDIAAVGLEDGSLIDLATRLAFTVTRFTNDWVGKKLHLAPPLVNELLEQLCRDALVEETMRGGDGRSHYRITQRGREHAERSLQICGYIGPAPVHLRSYAAMLRWQFSNQSQVLPEHVTKSLAGLVLTPKAAELAGLGVSSGRSLFVYGPPGNGKSSLGRAIQSALPGDYWVPHCVNVGNAIIRIFDDQLHQRAEVAGAKHAAVDQRWVLIRRPMVIVGGELTLEMLDLLYSPVMRYYEAPPHLKANGGVFLIDDFGRERMEPQQLLNRFITPMEHHIDYFTLSTGQKIQVPLRHVLIIATNLDPQKIMDPAFLRRMGYRIFLGPPSPKEYKRIFEQYAQRLEAAVAPGLIERVLERYRSQNRELRACEPRDLIERARDICRFHGRPLELTPKIIDLAWTGYFGNEEEIQSEKDEDLLGNGTVASEAKADGATT